MIAFWEWPLRQRVDKLVAYLHAPVELSWDGEMWQVSAPTEQGLGKTILAEHESLRKALRIAKVV